jgi:hypothetical protein
VSWDTARLTTASVASIVLLASGSSKIANHGIPIGITLNRIRVRGGKNLGITIGCYEVALSCLVLISPGPVISTAVLSSGLLVAGAGFRATRLDESVSCNCGLFAGRLGWKQILTFPIWAAVAWAEVRLGYAKSVRIRLLIAILCAVVVWKSVAVQGLRKRMSEGRLVFEKHGKVSL